MEPSVRNPLLAVPTSEETLLDKVQLLSDAIVELRGSVNDLKYQLIAEKDKLEQLQDRIGMSRLEYDSFRDTEKLPSHLLRKKEIRNSYDQQLKMNTDVLLEDVGLSNRPIMRNGKIDWDQSVVGKKLNQLIADVEKETAETTDFIEDQ